MFPHRFDEVIEDSFDKTLNKDLKFLLDEVWIKASYRLKCFLPCLEVLSSGQSK